MPAADQTLGFALISEQNELVPVLACTLLNRGSDEAIEYVIRAYHKLDAQIQQNLIERCPGISAALRVVSKDQGVQARNNVISIISAANHPKLAYILSYMLHDEVPALRTSAAEAFKTMALCLVTQSETPKRRDRKGADTNDDLNQFLVTLDSSLETFVHHLRTEVVEAAMYFGPLLPKPIWNKFTGERSRVGRTAVEILQRDSNVNFAGFAFRALSCPELGKAVIKIIAAGCNGDFFRRWLSFSWYRYDQNVRKNLARISKEFSWLAGGLHPLLETPPDLQLKFIDILMLTAIPAQEKQEILSALMMAHDPQVQEHVVHTLTNADLPDVQKLLERAISLEPATRFSARAARMAHRHLIRINSSNRAHPVLPIMLDAKQTQPGIEQYFDQLWFAFDRLDPSTARAAIERLVRLDEYFIDHTQEKIASPDPEDRMRVLALIRLGRLPERFAEDIYRLCNDIDPMVRSFAVRLLADIPGPATEKKLIEALDDDDQRVQANAIEALEKFNPPDIMEILEPKLESSNNRIRANAIKAILKPQFTLALRVLSSMLDHPDPTFRRSALWAVIKTTPLHLGAKIDKLAREDPDPDVKAIAQQAMKALLQNWKEAKNIEVNSGVNE